MNFAMLVLAILVVVLNIWLTFFLNLIKMAGFG
jgi:hypothetical protein